MIRIFLYIVLIHESHLYKCSGALPIDIVSWFRSIHISDPAGLAKGFIDNGYDFYDLLVELILEKKSEFDWGMFGGEVKDVKDDKRLQNELSRILVNFHSLFVDRCMLLYSKHRYASTQTSTASPLNLPPSCMLQLLNRVSTSGSVSSGGCVIVDGLLNMGKDKAESVKVSSQGLLVLLYYLHDPSTNHLFDVKVKVRPLKGHENLVRECEIATELHEAYPDSFVKPFGLISGGIFPSIVCCFHQY